jgi:RecA-family ATPase
MLAAVGRLLLLAAREKVGKSTVCAWLLAMLSTGRDLFGQKIAPQKLLWISFEESPDQVVPRFLAMEASEDEVTYIDGWEMVASNTMPEVYRIIRAQRSALVVIDSLSRMVTRGGDVRNENEAVEWVPIFEELKSAATASGSAVVLLHHTSKVTNEPRGSTMIASAVDDVAIMSRVGQDKQTLRIRVEGRTFNNTFALRQTENGLGFTQVPLVSKRAMSSEELHSLVIETLLAAPGISGTALKVKLGKKKSLVDKAVNELLALGTLERTGAGPKSGLRVASAKAIADRSVCPDLAA